MATARGNGSATSREIGLRPGPLKAETRVRIPMEPPAHFRRIFFGVSLAVAKTGPRPQKPQECPESPPGMATKWQRKSGSPNARLLLRAPLVSVHSTISAVESHHQRCRTHLAAGRCHCECGSRLDERTSVLDRPLTAARDRLVEAERALAELQAAPQAVPGTVGFRQVQQLAQTAEAAAKRARDEVTRLASRAALDVDALIQQARPGIKRVLEMALSTWAQQALLGDSGLVAPRCPAPRRGDPKPAPRVRGSSRPGGDSGRPAPRRARHRDRRAERAGGAGPGARSAAQAASPSR